MNIADELPDVMGIGFEDLAIIFDEGKILYRARVHDDRMRKDRFESSEMGAPPPDEAKAGRANRKGHPVLYLASNRSTALAEVRAWKGAAVALAEVRTKRRLLLVESLIGRLRDECLNEHLFRSLPAARRTIELWQVDYNPQRPHTSLNGLTPFAFANRPYTGHNQNGLWL